VFREAPDAVQPQPQPAPQREGETAQEIAERLGVPLSTVRNWRGRGALVPTGDTVPPKGKGAHAPLYRCTPLLDELVAARNGTAPVAQPEPQVLAA
jgi:hypothetical protein